MGLLRDADENVIMADEIAKQIANQHKPRLTKEAEHSISTLAKRLLDYGEDPDVVFGELNTMIFRTVWLYTI